LKLDFVERAAIMDCFCNASTHETGQRLSAGLERGA